MKKLNPHAVDFVINCIMFCLLLFLVSLLFQGCSAERISTERDKQALQRVLASRYLIDKAKPAIDQLYPCVPDTVGIVYPGGVDSIPYPVPVFETIIVPNDMDSLQIEAAYERGYRDARKYLSALKLGVKHPDTLRMIDRRNEEKLQKEIYMLKGNIEEKQKQIDAEKGSQRTWLWLFILAIVGLIASNVTWFFYKYKNKYP